ncbi:MAG TPA: TonB-dependent receptor, partial [Caulobacteraceae bacterium]|nr:TonB-dependent receptor [Caulobacteraceae bacterium]
MQRFCLPILALGGSLCLVGPALADPAAADVVITSSRLSQPLAITPDATVISREQIQSRGAVFAADVLATVPGVIIGENGFGGISSLSLRGASSNKTLVLIDGVPVNDPSQPQGSFDFSGLDLASTQRIEVLNGPQGAIWGSDAIGGVVSIISLEPDGLSASGEVGSLATYRQMASAGISTERYAAGVSYGGFRTAGVPNADQKFGNTQPDGFNDTTVSLNGRLEVNDRVSLDSRVRYVHAAEEYDIFSNPAHVTDPTASSVVESEAGYVRARIKDVLGFDQELRVDLMGLDRNYFGKFPFGAHGDQEVLRWTATRQEKTWGLQFGAEHKRAAENTGGGLLTRNDDGLFVIGRWSPQDRLNLTASVRQDAFNAYGNQTTARGGASLRLGGGFTVVGSVGQGFKAPTVFEVTYPCLECTVPGPPKTLRAEQALGEDVGLDWSTTGGDTGARITLFNLSVTNQIDYIYPTGYLNQSHVRTAGLEFSGHHRLGHGFSL